MTRPRGAVLIREQRHGLSAPLRSIRAVARAVAIDAIVVAALTAAIAGVRAKFVHAADAPRIMVKVAGKLPVPATSPLGVIATDPVLQQVLSQDFQVAGRLAGTSATSELTLTVTVSHRALEPGMSLNEVARGNSQAVALLEQAGVKQAGVKPPPMPEQRQGQNQDQDSDFDSNDINAAEGNSRAKNDVNQYEQQGSIEQGPLPMGGPMGLPMRQWPVPPATAQERSAIPPDMQPYQRTNRLDEARREREAGSIYDTVFVAHATAENVEGELTVVALAHPGFDAHEVRKLIAEEIANNVLH
jgi:hypothetical protein